jgi:hypothetical protein
MQPNDKETGLPEYKPFKMAPAEELPAIVNRLDRALSEIVLVLELMGENLPSDAREHLWQAKRHLLLR